MKENEQNQQGQVVTELQGAVSLYTGSDIPEELRETFDLVSSLDPDSEVPRLPIIKIKHGAGLFRADTGQGEEVQRKFVYGVVVESNTVMQYRKDENDRDSTCFSNDGNVPSGSAPEKMGSNCRQCQLSKFDFDNNPPLCKMSRRLYVLWAEPDSKTEWEEKGKGEVELGLTPYLYVLSVSPKSLKHLKNYSGTLASHGLKAPLVFTGFALNDKKEGNREWSELEFFYKNFPSGPERINYYKLIADRITFIRDLIKDKKFHETVSRDMDNPEEYLGAEHEELYPQQAPPAHPPEPQRPHAMPAAGYGPPPAPGYPPPPHENANTTKDHYRESYRHYQEHSSMPPVSSDLPSPGTTAQENWTRKTGTPRKEGKGEQR